MSFDPDFKFEKFEEYYGDAEQVKKIMDECPICGSRLVFSHMSDYQNLYIRETAHCPDCGSRNRKLLHILN